MRATCSQTQERWEPTPQIKSRCSLLTTKTFSLPQDRFPRLLSCTPMQGNGLIQSTCRQVQISTIINSKVRCIEWVDRLALKSPVKLTKVLGEATCLRIKSILFHQRRFITVLAAKLVQIAQFKARQLSLHLNKITLFRKNRWSVDRLPSLLSLRRDKIWEL